MLDLKPDTDGFSPLKGVVTRARSRIATVRVTIERDSVFPARLTDEREQNGGDAV